MLENPPNVSGNPPDEPENPLDYFEKKQKFLVGIDSDGCAFDTMETKHKECFIPNTVKYYDLQPVSRYARETAEFVNLYSKWRGINRFPALIRTLDLLAQRTEVTTRRVDVPRLQGVRDWIERETKLGNPALEREVEKTSDPDLMLALKWSVAVNQTIDDLVHGVAPFPFVHDSLQKLAPVADLMVCSATPNDALNKEWAEHKIDQFVSAICGQEVGSKKESLGFCAAKGYPPDHVLMIGDAPGDQAAAKSVGALFYPINPGAEEASWERLFSEAAEKFLNGTYAGQYEDALIAEFDTYLPEVPPWETTEEGGHRL